MIVIMFKSNDSAHSNPNTSFLQIKNIKNPIDQANRTVISNEPNNKIEIVHFGK